MILSGKAIVARGILRGLISAAQQVQPCGVDLTLHRVLRWSSVGVVDFDNTRHSGATTEEIALPHDKSIHLDEGAYLVELNEKVATPLDAMGQIFVRSSLFRSGAAVSAGVMDAGYEGAIGAMLQVYNPKGFVLYRDAKLAQLVFYQMSEEVEGYSGDYQNSLKM